MQYYGDLLRKLTNSNTTDVCEFFIKKCLLQAKSKATNEAMKRFFMICAVSANDGLRELITRNDLVFSSYWAHRRYFAKVRDDIPAVVKAYLSCLLLLLAAQKDIIFQKTGLHEAKLLYLWCDIFRYEEADREFFDAAVKAVIDGEAGLQRIFEHLNKICHERLNGGEAANLPCNAANRDFLLHRLGEDAYTLVARLREYPDISNCEDLS